MIFNKLIATGVLIVAIAVFGVGMVTQNITSNPINHRLLATVIYFDAVLFASIFSGLVYTVPTKKRKTVIYAE